VGSLAIRGYRVSHELHDQMTRIINGEVAADEVRQEIFLSCRKSDISRNSLKGAYVESIFGHRHSDGGDIYPADFLLES
jgi:hypothetical protein